MSEIGPIPLNPEASKHNLCEYAKAPEGINDAFYVEQVTDEMRQAVMRVINDTDSTSEYAQASRKVGAFLQYGYEPDSEELMVEFWKGDEADHKGFIDLVMTEYKKRIVGTT